MEVIREAGLRNPEDVSVIGFDDIYFSRFCTPPMTTVSVPRDHLGKVAFEALRNITRNPKLRGNEYIVETDLVLRKSTACPRR